MIGEHTYRYPKDEYSYLDIYNSNNKYKYLRIIFINIYKYRYKYLT